MLGDWLRNRADIFKAVNSGRVNVNREAPIQFPKTEEAVIKWLRTSRDGHVGISGPVLLCQAGRPHTEADIQLALTEDEELEPWGFLTDEDIVQEVQAEHQVSPEVDEVSSDEDEHEPSPQLCPKPSYAEFRRFIDSAELYLSYEDGPKSDEMYSLIQRIQTLML